MPNSFNKEKNTNPVIIPIIFVLDSSDSSSEWMKNIMKSTIQHLCENTSFKNDDIQVGVLISGNVWITGDRLIPVIECKHLYLPINKKSTITEVAATLNQSLTEDKLFCFDTDHNIFQPSIIILTDGKARGMDIYLKSEIIWLWNNEIYKSSNRFLISLHELKNEEVYVNLVREGTYIDIKDDASPIINELISDLLINQWFDSKVNIEERYKDIIHVRNIIISQ